METYFVDEGNQGKRIVEIVENERNRGLQRWRREANERKRGKRMDKTVVVGRKWVTGWSRQ